MRGLCGAHSQVGTVIFLVVACPVADARPDISLPEVAARLKERESRIIDAEGDYECTPSVSDTYAKIEAEVRKVRPRDVRERYDVRVLVHFAARRSNALNERLLDSRTMNTDGTQLNHAIIAFDGSDHYTVHNVPTQKQRLVSQITVGRPITQQFDSECDLAILLGLCLPMWEGTLSQCITKYGAEVEKTSGSGSTRMLMRLGTTPIDPADTIRYSVAFDVEDQLRIRRIVQERLLEDASSWTASKSWEVQEFGPIGPDGLTYPMRATRTELGMDDTPLITTVLSTTNLRFNTGLTSRSFKPSIEDGSNIFDERTQKGYVAGGKPSIRIKNFLKQSAEEGRHEVELAREGRHRRVPSMVSNRLGWAITAAGLLVIIVASIWRIRAGQAVA